MDYHKELEKLETKINDQKIEKAKLEERQTQLKKQKEQLLNQLKELNIPINNLDVEINKLENEIRKEIEKCTGLLNNESS
jgi:septal ring factor EnvC (AmiA/AmiB activator)